jgi:hypothetical protein
LRIKLWELRLIASELGALLVHVDLIGKARTRARHCELQQFGFVVDGLRHHGAARP